MTSITDKVDRLFTQWDKPDSPGCALAVIQNGEIIYKRGYGMANLEYNIPISPNSVFDIGSNSKQFTAMCIVLLARQNLLSLDDEVQKYIPEIPQYSHPITLQNLIYHTSGLRDFLTLMNMSGMNFENKYPTEEIITLLARQQSLNFEPGTERLYCNSGYLLLGEIVKRVSGKSLKIFAQEQIFAPLGMKNTHFHDDYKEIVKNRASGYAPKKGGGFQISMSWHDNAGAGFLYTTVEDLLLWDLECGGCILTNSKSRDFLNLFNYKPRSNPMTAITDKVDRLFTQWDKPDSPGCALAVIQNGEIIYKRGYGMANLEYDIPISSNSVFDIASNSKQFTAMCIVLLARENLLNLGDEVQKYIPEIPQYERPIAIRHLICHSSGLRTI